MKITRRHVLGILAVSCLGVCALPLYVLLIMYGSIGLSSHSEPTSNEIWGCSQSEDSCTGPQYYQAVIAVILMAAILVLMGWMGQRVARFSHARTAVALLSIYCGLVVAGGLIIGFVALSAG